MNDRAYPLQGDTDADELDARNAVEDEAMAGEPVGEPDLEAEKEPGAEADELRPPPTTSSTPRPAAASAAPEGEDDSDQRRGRGRKGAEAGSRD